jgi:diguanylate cyclase (GGDEF)-like protein/PAS domain S-box-containing protein
MPLHPHAGHDLSDNRTQGKDAAGTGNGLNDLLALASAQMGLPMAAIVAGTSQHPVLVAAHGLAADCGTVLDNTHPFVRHWAQHDPVLVLHDLPPDPTLAIRFQAGIALHDAEGQPVGLLVLCDQTPRAPLDDAAVQTLQRLGRLAAALLQQDAATRQCAIIAQASRHAREAVLVTDRHGHIRWSNPAAEQLFGPLVNGQPFRALIPLRLQPDQDATRRWLDGHGPEQVSLRIVALDGSLRQLDATRSSWQYGHEHGVTMILHDVTEAAQQRAQLDRLAHFDPLTGLPNRNALLAALERHPDWGLVLIGIDRFKWINDGLGHALGDCVLQAFAERLQARADADLCLARVEGDVFALACADARLNGEGDQADWLTSWLRALEHPIRVRGHQLQLELSTGVALRADVQAGADLLACADLALQRAKATGGRQLCRYQPQMRTEALARRNLDLELRRAVANDELELHYQPQIDLASGRICGAEALLRWRHPQRGLVPAGEFIELLARSPLSSEIGAWVLQRACKDAARWPVPISISINLFPAQLCDDLVPQVLRALSTYDLPAHRLELEITEITALNHDDSAAAALSALRARGVNLAFDDFGTGYASLALLHRFRIDRVKIDRSFVAGMLDNSEDAAIVRWTVMLSRALGMRVVAEGVERPDQADALRALGCAEAQGYLYAPALDADTLHQRLLAQQEHGHA